MSELVVLENVLRAVVWAQALERVRDHLLAPLVKRYTSTRKRIRDGKLGESALVAEASAFDLTANLLARYTADRPAELAELAVTVDGRHYPLFAEAIKKNQAAVVLVLKAVGATQPRAGTADADQDAHAKRQAHAAAVILTLGEAEAVWPLFAFPKNGDPTARNYLLERLAVIGANPLALIQRFAVETDSSARSALLIALGDFVQTPDWGGVRRQFSRDLLTLYRTDPDPGLHSAIDWLLRQRWGKGKELAAIDAELAAAAHSRVAARAMAGAVRPAVRWCGRAADAGAGGRGR